MQIAGVPVNGISTEHGGSSGAVAARALGRDFGLVLLEADAHVSVALVPGAVEVLGVLRAVATVPVEQFAVHVLHRVNLQLKIARGLGHLNRRRTVRKAPKRLIIIMTIEAPRESKVHGGLDFYFYF